MNDTELTANEFAGFGEGGTCNSKGKSGKVTVKISKRYAFCPMELHNLTRF